MDSRTPAHNRELTRQQLQSILQGLDDLCDGAVKRDYKGFSKSHSHTGHYLASVSCETWDFSDLHVARFLAYHHRKQIEKYNIAPVGKNDADYAKVAQKAQIYIAKTQKAERIRLEDIYSKKPFIVVRHDKGPLKKLPVYDYTWKKLISEYPDPSLYNFSKDELNKVIQRIGRTEDTLFVALKLRKLGDDRLNHHYAYKSIVITGPSKAMRRLSTARKSLNEIEGAVIVRRYYEFPPFVSVRAELRKEILSLGLNIVIEPEQKTYFEASFAQQQHYSYYGPREKHMHWDFDDEGKQCLIVNGGYSEHWLQMVRERMDRCRDYQDTADRFPATAYHDLCQIFKVLQGVSHITEDQVVEIRTAALREDAPGEIQQEESRAR